MYVCMYVYVRQPMNKIMILGNVKSSVKQIVLMIYIQSSIVWFSESFYYSMKFHCTSGWQAELTCKSV